MPPLYTTTIITNSPSAYSSALSSILLQRPFASAASRCRRTLTGYLLLPVEDNILLYYKQSTHTRIPQERRPHFAGGGSGATATQVTTATSGASPPAHLLSSSARENRPKESPCKFNGDPKTSQNIEVFALAAVKGVQYKCPDYLAAPLRRTTPIATSGAGARTNLASVLPRGDTTVGYAVKGTRRFQRSSRWLGKGGGGGGDHRVNSTVLGQ